MAKVIFENNLKELALSLSKDAKVFAPVKTHPNSTYSQYSFVEFSKEMELVIDYPTTNLPPKEFLLPPKDILFTYSNGQSQSPVIEKKVIFGLSYEDLYGVEKLTKLFSSPIKDDHFLEIKDSTLIIGADHFSPPKSLNFDLYLQKINSEIYVGHAGTKKGSQILKNSLFKNQEIKIPKVSKKKDLLLSNPDLPKIIMKSKDHPVWNDLAKICLGCGICSYVCPLCYCFEIDDEIDITKDDICSTKCRTWDSCMLNSFAETNAGNFRGELSERIYNWYFHKFVRMPKEYGFSGCVDCNRCVIFCPAKINYRNTLMRLVKDWESKNERS